MIQIELDRILMTTYYLHQTSRANACINFIKILYLINDNAIKRNNIVNSNPTIWNQTLNYQVSTQ